MARPAAITPDVAAHVDRLRASLPGLPLRALVRLLASTGVNVSASTLSRHLRGASVPPAPKQAAPVEADTTPPGLAAEIKLRYLEVRNVVERVKNEATLGGPALSRWLRAVNELGELAERLCRMVPPSPPDPDHDPANVAARERLLKMADEVIARGA